MKNISKNVVLWIIIGLLLIVLFNLFQGTSNNRNTSKISFSDFIAATESGNVSEVNINGSNVTGFLNDGRSFSTYVPNYPNLVDKLNESGVKITAEPSERSMPTSKCSTIVVPNAFINWSMDFLYETNAVRWR